MHSFVGKRKRHCPLDKLYSLVHSKTSSIGGGGAGGSIYGEITQQSFHNLVELLVDKCNFTTESIFLDIGSGLGKPNLHVSLYPGVEKSYGVEIHGGRWWQSLSVLKECIQNDIGLQVFLAHADICSMSTLDPISHVYTFNPGFPVETMQYVATIFHSSNTTTFISCYDKPTSMEDYGFDVTFIQALPMKLAGSREQHTCYTYKRNDTNIVNDCQWTLPPIPTDYEYKPYVEHTTNYKRGLSMMNSKENYINWLNSEIGLDRSKRTTRSHNFLDLTS